MLKLKAIKYKGGKCIECGYDKCPAALVFHHRNPDEKEFDWNKMRKLAWDTIKTELDKCDLLCCRCHTETHYDPSITEEAIEWLNNRQPQISKSKYDKNGICKQCKTPFKRNRNSRNKVYCSVKCSDLSQLRADYPPDNEFVELVDEIGRVKAGKMFGVSDRAIGKRYKKIINNCCSTNK